MWWKRNKKVICFDLGGTNLRQAVIDFSHKKPLFLDFRKKKRPPFSQLRNEVKVYVEEAEKKYGTKKVAIASAGIVDKKKKKIFQATQCYGKDSFSFDFLEKRRIKVFLENDGKAFALGSYYFELNKEPFSVLSLFIGTGIGGGLIFSGKNFLGAHFSAMEISHLFFSLAKGEESWENLSAGKGIEKKYQELTQKSLSAKKIYDLAELKNVTALQVLKDSFAVFSRGLANLVNIFDPEIIVLGGTVTEERRQYFQLAIENSQKWVFNQRIKPFVVIKNWKKNNQKDKTKIFFSRLGEKAILLGAGYLAIKERED